VLCQLYPSYWCQRGGESSLETQKASGGGGRAAGARKTEKKEKETIASMNF